MDKEKLEELRQYYDNTDTSAEIADAEVDDEIVQSPMVGITVRLPAEVLQRIRELAANDNVKTTALIRRWIEEATGSGVPPQPAPAVEISWGATLEQTQSWVIDLTTTGMEYLYRTWPEWQAHAYGVNTTLADRAIA
jgi:hypothetical protein